MKFILLHKLRPRTMTLGEWRAVLLVAYEAAWLLGLLLMGLSSSRFFAH